MEDDTKIQSEQNTEGVAQQPPKNKGGRPRKDAAINRIDAFMRKTADSCQKMSDKIMKQMETQVTSQEDLSKLATAFSRIFEVLDKINSSNTTSQVQELDNMISIGKKRLSKKELAELAGMTDITSISRMLRENNKKD